MAKKETKTTAPVAPLPEPAPVVEEPTSTPETPEEDPVKKLEEENFMLKQRLAMWTEDYDTLQRVVKILLQSEGTRYAEQLYSQLIKQVVAEKRNAASESASSPSKSK